MWRKNYKSKVWMVGDMRYTDGVILADHLTQEVA